MNKYYLRILSIRKHKTITFLSVYSNEFGNMQCMIDNEILSHIKCGDLIECDLVTDINKRGEQIKRIAHIYKIINCNEFPSYKGITREIEDKNLEYYVNARNCGKQLSFIKFKQELLYNIKEILNKMGYFDSTGLLNTVEHYANGSNISDAIIQNRGLNSPRFLRVTLENQLKQMSAILLKSAYAIEKVFRNMGEDSSHINEFLMLELVDINSDMNKILELIKLLDMLSKELCEKYQITIPDKDLKIFDYNELNSQTFEEIKKINNNLLVVNYPCDSPFILKDDLDERKEVRWYVNGHWIGHYYKDEYEYDNVKEVLEKQACFQEKEYVNPMTYFEWGLPASVSMGLSIDRWLQMLLDIEHINGIANPIELDYKRRLIK